MTTSASSSRGITGRDGYIFAKSLAYAIATIESLPDIRQEWSDCQDMKTLLAATITDDRHRLQLMYGARAHMGLEEFFLKPGDSSADSD